MQANIIAGYGERTITPPLGTELTGYGYYLNRRAESVLDDLKVRTLSLYDGTTRLMLVVNDLLGFTIEFSDRMRQRIAEAVDAVPMQVLLACTHTHCGPTAQPLEGLGAIDPSYLAALEEWILAAACEARADEREATFSYRLEMVEPVGRNRRIGGFSPIDPMLAVGVLQRDDRKLFLLNYACHPVTLGRLPAVSADWPGAVARAVEAEGQGAIVFQGFCGDLEPVSNGNRWGMGKEEDLDLIGHVISRRAFSAERYAVTPDVINLRAGEQRIDLPLEIPTEDQIRQEVLRARHDIGAPALTQFLEWWEQEALKLLPSMQQHPYLTNVPMQGMAIGEFTILALPGEVFCEYGIQLRDRWPALCPIGYANGNVGYLPTRPAFDDAGDYACYSAPKFYSIFRFTPEVEDIVVGASREVLAAL
ncbi:MAG: hypothetical protein ACYDBB_18740 [Armatimonadota bacterium]